MNGGTTGAQHGGVRRRSPLLRVCAGLIALAGVFGLAWGGEGAPPAAGPPPGEPVGAVEVSEFKLSYPAAAEAKHTLYEKHPGLPKLEDVAQLPMRLGKAADGYVALRNGAEAVTLALGDVPKLPLKRFYPSAIVSIEEQIVAWFNARRVVGVFVATHPADMIVQFDRARKVVGLEDLRGDRKDLRLVVWVGLVTKVRTVASGARVPQDKRMDHPLHERIRQLSPVQAAAAGAAERHDVMDKGSLERYTGFLSRHPGRRVDAALSSDDRPGGVVLDYLVSESKPWFAYFQVSSTGTQYTRPWRERFGFVHNQLTNHDDVLTLDYSTAGFDAAHAVTLSYEVPVFQFDRLRWRTYASWSKYTASDVGIAEAEYRGQSCSVGTELIWNFFQHKALFVDAVFGGRCEHLRVEDMLLGEEGDERLLITYCGLRFQRLTELATTYGSVILEKNHPGAAGTHVDELEKLGRTDPDRTFHVLKYDLSHSFYLEPLLNPTAWEDPTTWRSSTLAHELAFSVRGQRAMGSRLIPQYEMVIGGAYTVRGYPESIAVGDSACVASAEYRFHVPRVFRPQAQVAKLPGFNQPFRFAPQQVYGRPDWDLVLRAFYDVGHVENTRAKEFEVDRTIRGAGVGVELRIKDNFSLRCDYGVALDDIRDPVTDEKRVNSGDHRIHTICTLSF
ncbi:MAG TPA: ShlB/FhaC/HecB family hemolysin secretion/activation protein [Planctomycetota bacterium]|nr:ShlB/FhaC/HecB family hemolysin secretion/activation protein [Planctomycetota bacterium]